MKQVCLVLIAMIFACMPSNAERPKKPLRPVCTFGPATAGKLVKMVRPRYPVEALAQKILGPVVLELTIDKKGDPQNIKVKKGNPVLADAVVAALKQWKYEPYKLNGEPVEVETTITVDFEPSR